MTVTGEILLLLRLLLLLALYVFIGWVLFTLWRDLRSQSRRLALPQAPALTLLLEGDATPQRFRFTTPEVTVGRDPTCEVQLSDQTISAQHARLSYHHGQWWVEDLNSTNGTFINQEPVDQPVVITGDDRLRCGQLTFKISIGANGTE